MTDIAGNDSTLAARATGSSWAEAPCCPAVVAFAVNSAAASVQTLTDIDPERDPASWEMAGAVRMLELIGPQGLARLADELARRGFIHLRGLPKDPAPPPTPAHADPPSAAITVTLANLFGLIGVLKLVSFAYAGENDGRIVRHVAARARAASEQSSHGWMRDLAWHMDCANRPLNERNFARSTGLSPAPEWLFWSVIYDQPSVPMTVTFLTDLLKHLGEDTIATLMRPEFDVVSADSFDLPKVTRKVALLIPNGRGGFFSRYNQVKCFGLNPAAQQALKAVGEALEEADFIRRLPIIAGDVIIVHNWSMLHMRPKYEPRWHGNDRWLVRIYASSDPKTGFTVDPSRPRVWI